MFKILLVEDNLNYRSILKGALLRKFAEIEIRETTGESDTLSTVRNFNPDLVITDLRLGDHISGLNLIKQIKSEYPQQGIIVLSDNDNEEYRSAAHNLGADNFFSKKSSLKSVLDYVCSAIKRKHEVEPGCT